MCIIMLLDMSAEQQPKLSFWKFLKVEQRSGSEIFRNYSESPDFQIFDYLIEDQRLIFMEILNKNT